MNTRRFTVQTTDLKPAIHAESDWQPIAGVHSLTDEAAGLRFEIDYRGKVTPAFVVRYKGQAYAYLNQCAHVAMELDWQPGQFFDIDQRYLMCATHAAMYEPTTGHCVAGPCTGKKLIPLKLKEQDGTLYAASH